MRTVNPLQGEVWDVNLDPTVGSEIQKTRPGIIVNPNGILRFDVRIVVPLTSWRSDYVGRVLLPQILVDNGNGLTKDSAADASQVRSVSVLRFGHRRGQVTAAQLIEVCKAATIAVGGIALSGSN